MRRNLTDLCSFGADEGRTLGLLRRGVFVAAAVLLLLPDFSLCSSSFTTTCKKSLTGSHMIMNKKIPVKVRCVGGCGASEYRDFDWRGCCYCEATDWVAILNEYGTNISGCRCDETKSSCDEDVYVDLTSTLIRKQCESENNKKKVCSIL